MGVDIAIDVGTSKTRIFIPNQGIVVNEPSVVTVDLHTNKPIAFGYKAYEMLGKTSERFSVIYPLSRGVVSDFNIVQEMLIYFLKKVGQGKLTLPRVVACIPSEITDVEKRAIVNSISATGVRKVFLIEDPVAAAIGSGIDIKSPQGFFIVDIGGGTTDMAVISLSGIASSRSVKIAGDTLDEEIIKYLKNHHNLLIGRRTAEKTKIEIGSAVQLNQKKVMRVKGRDLLTGMPKGIDVKAEELSPVIKPYIEKIIKNIKELMEETEPELLGDIFSGGIHLSGGGANLEGIKNLIEEKIKIPVIISNESDKSVIRGAGEAIKYIGDLENKAYGAINPLSDEY